MPRDNRPRPGASFAVGSLPHRRAADAVDFSWRATTIPTIPSLPRRSPSELMVAQALIGIEGVSLGQYGGINVDIAPLKPIYFTKRLVGSPRFFPRLLNIRHLN
jgi:hypothetical protein